MEVKAKEEQVMRCPQSWNERHLVGEEDFIKPGNKQQGGPDYEQEEQRTEE